MSSTATPITPWYPCCGVLSTETHGSSTDVSKPSALAVARKQIPPFLGAISQSINCLSSNCKHTSWGSPATLSGGIRTKSGCSLLIGSPVLKACCTPPNCDLCPWLHTDGKTVMKFSWVCVGECDSMSRRSGSVKPLMMSRALARRPDGIAVVWLPNTSPTSIHRTIRPTLSSLSRLFQR